MAETWLDKFDLSTPSLTRASSTNSRNDEGMEEEAKILAQKISQLSISIGPNDILDNENDVHVCSDEPQAIFVDEPESYEGAKSPVLFEGSVGALVSSPDTAEFSLSHPSEDTERGEDSSEAQILTWMPSEGLVSSPGLASSPGLVSSPGFGSSHGLLTSPGLVPSPISATFSSEDTSPPTEPLQQERRPGCRRKALVIGIRYDRETPNERVTALQGPHHDVEEVQRLLLDVGWHPDCFRVLKDDNGPKVNQPTLENIRHEIKQLVEGARRGDHLFFYFSGHGGQVNDTDGDEEDGMDEVIVCCDGKYLVDDELHEILVKPIPAGCHLTALLDCCSSGTSLDLQYDGLQSRERGSPRHPRVQARKKQSKGNVVLLSACPDAERAYEKRDHEDEDKRVRGMLTKAFIDSLKTRRQSTYDELMTSVRSHLRRRDTMQDPQLSSSRVLDMKKEYFTL